MFVMPTPSGRDGAHRGPLHPHSDMNAMQQRNSLGFYRLKTAMMGALLAAGATFATAQTQQTYSVAKISEDSNIRSDQRPISIGFYDPDAKKTFVSWMTGESHAIVKEFDHSTGKWSEDKIVGRSPSPDKHNYPGMLRGRDGRIYVFYGCHNSTMRLAISPKPGSIDGKWEDRDIPEAERASYPAPVITADGDMYVFYRDTRKTSGHADDRPYQYVKSTDNGKTWTRHMAVDPYPRKTDNMCEVYNGMVSYQPPMNGQKARIHLAWTIAGEKLGRHAHATYGRNVYYAYLDPETGHMHNIRDEDLGPHIDNVEMDKSCMVLDTGIPERSHLAGLQVSAHYRDNGMPLLHFDNRPAGGISSATWDGSSWKFTVITPGGGEPRGLEKFGPDSFRVYRPRGDNIEVFATTDGGASWAPEATIPVGQRVDRCLVIDNYHPDAKLLITEAGDGDIRVAKRDVFIGKVAGGAGTAGP
jgi:hypothetical protein